VGTGRKASLANAEADLLGASNPELREKRRTEAERYKSEQDEIEKTAREIGKKVVESNQRAERFLERHHKFALSVTLCQVAIALSAIAALTRRKLLWWSVSARAESAWLFSFRDGSPPLR
jgi:predicted transcriptional regulator